MPQKSSNSNPLYVLEEFIQALNSDDKEIIRASDRLFAVTGIRKEDLLNTSTTAHRNLAQVNSLTDAVVHLDNNLTILSWNPAATRIYGYSSEEALGRHIEELLKTEYDLESREHSLEAFREYGSWSGEVTHMRKDGIRIPVFSRSGYSHDSRGLVTGIVSTLKDISGNITSGSHPELMTTRLRTMLKTTNDAIRDWDIKANRHWWSEGIERVFGYDPGQLEPGPESWYNRIHPDDKKRVIDGIHLSINGSATYWQDDYRFLKNDGNWAYVADRAYIIRDEAGLALRIIGGLSDRSEQRKMFDDLANAHKRIKLHIRNSPLAVIEWDTGFNLSSWNERAEEIFGWPAEEVLGQNTKSLNFVYEEDQAYVDQKMEELTSGKVRSNVVINRNYCKDGRVIYCEWYNSSVLDDDGNAISFFSQAHDITEQEIAVRKLEESEARLSQAQKIARLGDWEMDLIHDHLDWSDEVFAIFGVRKEDFDGNYEAFISRIHPEDREMVSRVRQNALENDKPSDVIHRIIRPDGEIRHLHQRGKLVRDENGNPMKLIGTVQDITELAEAQQKLRESEEMYRTIVDTAQEGIWMINHQGETTYVNQRMADILGYTTVEMAGRSFYEFVDESFKEKAAGEFQKLKKGNTGTRNIRIRHRDGHPVWVQYKSNPIYNDKGHFTAALAMVTDITGKLQDEEVIASSLREKQVMLEEIHHRVKNNMQLISSLMQLQSMNVSDDTVKELFDDSQSRILSMALVHENLYQTENMSSIDFSEYLEKLVVNLKAACARTPVTIRVDSEPIGLSVDRAIPLGLIVNELVTNAIRHAFTDGRPGTIVVGLRKDGEKYMLTVKDDGIGFTRNGSGKPGGIGMELVDGLVRQIKGTMVFRKKKGTAAELTFSS